jgi:hypothetical protein
MILGIFNENPPQLQSSSSSLDWDNREWVEWGSYRFTRLEVDLIGWEVYGLSRYGDYTLHIPVDGSEKLIGTEYQDAAISQSRENAGPWKINAFAVLLSIALATASIRFGWWLLEKDDKNTADSTVPSEGMPSGVQ